MDVSSLHSAKLYWKSFSTYASNAQHCKVAYTTQGNHCELSLEQKPPLQVVWSSSKVLIDILSTLGCYIQNKHVLELGAGTGLLSIYCHHARASSVLATDMISAMPLLERNIARHCKNDRLQTMALNWGSDDAVPCPIDTILACDTLYHEHLHHKFLHTLCALTLHWPKAFILLCFPHRSGQSLSFIEMAKHHFEIVKQMQRRDKTDSNALHYIYVLRRIIT